MADYADRWEIIDELGRGGQGTVYRVRDKQKCKSREEIGAAVLKHVRGIQKTVSVDNDREVATDGLIDTILEIVRGERPEVHAALKVLNTNDDSRDPENSPVRLVREIKGMTSLSHPNLLKIIDVDSDHEWFVSELQVHGSLRQNSFAGNPLAALTAIRPLVEGVSRIHENSMVHRDIKAENIFVAGDNRLVLGDFGLIFFCDDTQHRLTSTLSNVGSWDWMPAWAQNARVEDLSPSFDVLCLGKVLWWMVSGLPIKCLKLWYIEDREIDVERLYPGVKFIWLIKYILRKCVVERENMCLPDAPALLQEIDGALKLIDAGGELLSNSTRRVCKVCGYGTYAPLADRDREKAIAFGLSPEENRSFKIFQCGWCGHVQLFSFTGGPTEMPGWQGTIQI